MSSDKQTGCFTCMQTTNGSGEPVQIFSLAKTAAVTTHNILAKIQSLTKS